jgi:hypothetical protein
MSNKNKETLQSNLDLFTFSKDTVNVNDVKGLKDLINLAYKKYSCLLGDDVIPLIDNAIQLDGNFFSFCKSINLDIKNLEVDSVTILSSDDESDPFVIQGCFLFKNEVFSFIKCSLFCKINEDSNQVSSFILLCKTDYDKYTAFKKQYSNFNKEIDGLLIRAIGGEDYYLDNCYTWDKLFFGEKTDLKKDIKSFLDEFKGSKDIYNEAKLAWKSTLLITGLPGNGKSELINTIVYESGYYPFTVTPEIDDSILAATFNYAASKENALLFIEDIDQLIVDNVIDATTIPFILDSLEPLNCSKGLVVIMSAVKIPESYKEIPYLFDKVVDLSFPEYDKCIPDLFGKFFSTSKLNQLKAECKKSNLSYGYIDKLYKIFANSMLKVNVDKKDESKYFEEIQKILKFVAKENDLVNKKYMKPSKKLGLDSKK